MEGLPGWKAERVASMRKELAELQRQVIEAQQRIATELQGRADDAERFEALEARLQAQELEAKQHATRNASLETDLNALKSVTEQLARDLATRDAQIEEARRQHRSLTQQLETQTALVNEAKAEAKTSRETRDTDLLTISAERDAAQASTARLERELEEQRKQHREVAEQLEAQLSSARDAQKLDVTRDAELAAVSSERDVLKTDLATLSSERDAVKTELSTVSSERDAIKTELSSVSSERDAVKTELEQARRDVDAGRAKIRDIATNLLHFGQELVDGGAVTQLASDAAPAVAVKRPQPPPLPPAPPPRAAAPADTIEPPLVEPIFQMFEEPKPATSPIRSALLLLGGVIAGCAVTIAVTRGGSTSTAASYREDVTAPLVASRSAEATSDHASNHASDPADNNASGHVPAEAIAAPWGASAPSRSSASSASAKDEPVPPPAPQADLPTTGAIVLPESAAGHRVFVDGRVTEVKSGRIIVPCGSHSVRIGSSGTEQKLDVECGGATAIGEPSR